jgi:hypothetical protein
MRARRLFKLLIAGFGFGVMVTEPLPALAQEYRVHGAGAVSCERWTAARAGRSTGETMNKGMMESWVEGYVSAANAFSALQGGTSDYGAGTDESPCSFG